MNQKFSSGERSIVSMGLGEGEMSVEGLSLRQHYIKVDGRKLCVCSWGAPGNPVVFLLHGMQSHAGLWDRLGTSLAERGYYVLAQDRRGHGYSDWFDTYNTLDYVLDINKLLSRVVAGPVIMLGHCESTILCSLFAGSFPEKVKSLILLQFPNMSRRVNAESRAELVKTFLQKCVPDADDHHPVFASADEATQRLLRDAPFKIPEVMARKVTPRNTVNIAGGVTWRWDPMVLKYRLIFDVIDIDLIAQLMKKIESKVTFIYGRNSSLIVSGEEKILSFVHTLLPQARKVLVAGGHYPHMEEDLSEELIRAIVDI